MGWLEDKAREQAFIDNARKMQKTAKEGAVAEEEAYPEVVIKSADFKLVAEPVEVNVDESDDPEIIIIDDLPDTEAPEIEEVADSDGEDES